MPLIFTSAKCIQVVVSTHLTNVHQIGLSSEGGENHFKLDIFSAQVDARPIQPPLGVGSPRRSNVAKGGVFFSSNPMELGLYIPRRMGLEYLPTRN